jgi:hypothetical protein
LIVCFNQYLSNMKTEAIFFISLQLIAMCLHNTKDTFTVTTL